MKNVKTKTKINEREITITIYADGEGVEKLVRYHNSCMICKEETINTEDFGEEYICPHCTEWLSEKLKSTIDLTTTKKPRKKPISRTLVIAKQYNPSIKIVNFIDYKNLMTHHKIPEKLVTVIIDLIIKGINTANKIQQILNSYKVETIYTYLTVMSKIGMLHCAEYKRRKTDRLDKIHKVHKNLIYTSVE